MTARQCHRQIVHQINTNPYSSLYRLAAQNKAFWISWDFLSPVISETRPTTHNSFWWRTLCCHFLSTRPLCKGKLSKLRALKWVSIIVEKGEWTWQRTALIKGVQPVLSPGKVRWCWSVVSKRSCAISSSWMDIYCLTPWRPSPALASPGEWRNVYVPLRIQEPRRISSLPVVDQIRKRANISICLHLLRGALNKCPVKKVSDYDQSTGLRSKIKWAYGGSCNERMKCEKESWARSIHTFVFPFNEKSKAQQDPRHWGGQDDAADGQMAYRTLQTTSPGLLFWEEIQQIVLNS